MADGDRHPGPPVADGGAATLPGVGTASPADKVRTAADVGTDATLAGAGPAPNPLGATAAGTAAPPPRAKRRTADPAHSETLPAPEMERRGFTPGLRAGGAPRP